MSDWNKKFTDLIRQNDGSLWGNWSLVAGVTLGDYGVIDPDTAEFTQMGNLIDIYEDLFTITSQSTGNFIYKTSGVQRHSASEKISGEFLEPETQTKVGAGIRFSWSFSNRDDMLANFTAVSSENLKPSQNLLRLDVFKTLLQAAGTVGKRMNSGGISPGFIVVTNVVRSACGFMVASEQANQKFSIGGEVNATSALVDGLEANRKAGYSFTDSSESIIKYVYPAPDIVVSPDTDKKQAAIAFKALSFNDRALLTNWKG